MSQQKQFTTFKDRAGKHRLDVTKMVQAFGYMQARRKLKMWGFPKTEINRLTEYLFTDAS